MGGEFQSTECTVMHQRTRRYACALSDHPINDAIKAKLRNQRSAATHTPQRCSRRVAVKFDSIRLMTVLDYTPRRRNP